MSGSVSVANDTLNTSFTEYLAFFINLFIFYRCSINSVVPPVPPLSEIFFGGTCPRQLYGAGAYGRTWSMTLNDPKPRCQDQAIL